MSLDFKERLLECGLTVDAACRGSAFRELVLEENGRQNLTRLTSAEDFFRGHVRDVLELRTFREKRGLLGASAVDLGSGAGVPGLLSAALFEGEQWVLVESELRKAEFLGRATQELALSDRVTVLRGRMETLGPEIRSQVVVSRAVGQVEKLFGWLEGCSTWNTLVLLKGPRWKEEWAEFLRGRHQGKLRLEHAHEYSVEGDIRRLIIQLGRVPRGTTKK